MRERESYSPLGALLLPLAVVALPVILYWHAFTLRGIFFFGDIVGQFYPLKVVLARALSSGQVPFWTADLMAGYPLLAEAEGGFMYPFSLIFSLVLPPTAALNYQLLAHLALAGLGMYLFCRVMRLDPLASALGGALYMLSGFTIAHLNHLSIISALAWLPYLFAVVELMVVRRRMGPYATLLGLLVALQALAGHAQISFLSLLGLGLYVLYRAAVEFVDGQGLGRPLSLLLASGLAVGLGVGVAAPQLLATYELTDLSVRAGGLSGDYFTSFSLPPPYIVTFLLPFVNGNPLASNTPATAVEWCGYAGVVTLLLAVYAALFRRDRYTTFFALLAIVGLLLALGQWNPLYHYLINVPGFNLFRVPARYLYLYTFAVSALAALGFGQLLRPGLPLAHAMPRAVSVVAALALLVLGGLAVVIAGDLDRLLLFWQVLPWALLVLGSIVVIARGRLLLGGTSFAVLSLLLIAIDLYAFNAAFGATFNATKPASELAQRPGVMDVLKDETGLYRVYTHERIYPAPVGVRESLAWNYALAAGVPTLSGYLPLTLDAYSDFAAKVKESARLANLANVKYLLVPQTLGDEEAIERENMANPLSPSPVGRRVEFPPTQAVALEVESSLSHSVGLADGSVVAEVRVSDGGTPVTIPLRAGIETAEWAYDRPDVKAQMKHARPQVVRQWPARTSYPPQSHNGNTYTARLPLSRPMAVSSIEIVPRHPQGYVHVERVLLVDSAGKRTPLSHLAGWGDFEIAYIGNEAVAFRNRDVRPRFSLVHSARRARNAEEVWANLAAADFNPAREVVLGPEERPTRLARLLALNPLAQTAFEPVAYGPAIQGEEGVDVVAYDANGATAKVRLSAPGYLVVADTFYPGWQANVDGKPAPIVRANWLFRAVELPAGEHTVEMRYSPTTQGVGWVLAFVSMLGLLALAAVPFVPNPAGSSWRSV